MITFRNFTDADWEAFAGCESAEPQIAEFDRFVVIVDGVCLTYFEHSADGDMECHMVRVFDNAVQARDVARVLNDAFEALPYHDWKILLYATVSEPVAF